MNIETSTVKQSDRTKYIPGVLGWRNAAKMKNVRRPRLTMSGLPYKPAESFRESIGNHKNRALRVQPCQNLTPRRFRDRNDQIGLRQRAAKLEASITISHASIRAIEKEEIVQDEHPEAAMTQE
jgi:hypothetical protein